VGFIPLRWENADGSEQGSSQGCGWPPALTAKNAESAKSEQGSSPACGWPLSMPPQEGEGDHPATPSSLFPLRSSTSTASGRFRRRYLEQELLEVSAVGIPANPNALVLGLKAGALETSDLRALAELLGHLLREPPSPPLSHRMGEGQGEGLPFHQSPSTPNHQPTTAAANANTGALGASGYEAQWLQLARALREVLKRA